jgi:hypothetical protein
MLLGGVTDERMKAPPGYRRAESVALAYRKAKSLMHASWGSH